VTAARDLAPEGGAAAALARVLSAAVGSLPEAPELVALMIAAYETGCADTRERLGAGQAPARAEGGRARLTVLPGGAP